MSEIVELRELEPQHAERMLRWMQDPEIADNVGLRSRPTLDRTREWIAKAQARDTVLAWAIIRAGEHVGNVVLDLIDLHLKSARLSIYVGEASARGQGAAARALRLALEHGFTGHGLERIWLTVHERNTRAALLYTRLGFRLEGILRGDFLLRGERINAVLMSILRSEFLTPAP
jgi:RimJ/RimL family protein N-acetyltransferase